MKKTNYLMDRRPPVWWAAPMTPHPVRVGLFGMFVAEGESVPGPILEIGNTNSRYRFPIGARRFVNEWNAHGPAHHCAVGVGHLAHKIEKLGKLLEIEAARVC